MLNIINSFKEKIFANVSAPEDDREVDNLIALGVLLRVVAQADDKFLAQEEEAIADILKSYSEINEDDLPIVLRSIHEATLSRVDLFEFTKEVNEKVDQERKINILEDLFRVACADKELDNVEIETIRKISGLLKLEHSVFIEVKIAVKKEFGLEVFDT